MKGKDLVKLIVDSGLLEKEIRWSCEIESGRSWSWVFDGNMKIKVKDVVKLRKGKDDWGSEVNEVVVDDEGEEVFEEGIVEIKVFGDCDYSE